MRWVGRALAWSIPLALIAFGVFWPLVFTGESGGAPPNDPVSFTNYRAAYVVDRNGQLDAVETITAEFPGGRHGIFRYWDTANPNQPHVRQVPTDISVLMDDKSIPMELSWENDKRFRVAKIGDPARYIDPGTHIFQIRYTVPGALDPGGIGPDRRFASSPGNPDAGTPSAFFWNVVSPGWEVSIYRADISVTLPGEVSGAECSVGYGVGQACDDLTVSGNRVRLTPSTLQPRTPGTVGAGVDVPIPPRATLPWSYRFDPIFGQSVSVVLWVVGLTVAAALGALLWWRSTVEPSPGFPLQYARPEGIGPVQSEYIRTEAVPRNALTATLFYLAERRLISLTQVRDKKWTIRGIAEPGAWADVDPVSVAAGSALGVTKPGKEFDANATVTAGRKLSKAKTDIAEAVQKWAINEKLLVKKRSELWVRGASATGVVVAICGFLRWGFPATMWGLAFAVFFLLALPTWKSGIGTRRTPAGRELWSRAGGFHRLISTDSAESRFDFAARQDLYAAYLPFAVAGGVAALWAKEDEVATGTPAPQPDRYH